MHRLALFLFLTGCSPLAITEGEMVAEKAAEGIIEIENPGKTVVINPAPPTASTTVAIPTK